MGYGFMIDLFLGFVQPLFPYTFDLALTPLLHVGTPATGARLTIAAVSIALSAILSIIYYLLLDVERYKELQDERKDLSKKMKAAQKKGNTEEANNYMKTMTSMQKEFFTMMIKPMLASMIIFMTLLPWMYTTFNPIIAAGMVNGTYTGTHTYDGVELPITVQPGDAPQVMVRDEALTVGDSYRMDGLTWKVKDIAVTDEAAEVKVAAVILNSPIPLPFTGKDIGWLGTYILVSIPFTFGFRKLLGIQ